MDASTYTQNRKGAVTASGDAAISGDKTRGPAPSSNTPTTGIISTGALKTSLDVFLARFKKETIVAGALNDYVAINGNGLSARFKSLIALYQIGDTIYVVDRIYNMIRMFNVITQDVTTYIASPADASLNPRITTTLFFYPNCIAHDPDTNTMYIGQGAEVLKVNMNSNTISRLNDGYFRFGGDTIVISSMVYKNGYLYGMDAQNGFVFKLNLSTQPTVFEVIAGAREFGYVDGIGTAARFNTGFLLTSCLTIDNSNNLYVADRRNGALRKINLSTLEVTTFIKYESALDVVRFNAADNSLYYAVGNRYIYKLSLDNLDENGQVASSDDGITTLTISDRKTLYGGSSRAAIYMYTAI